MRKFTKVKKGNFEKQRTKFSEALEILRLVKTRDVPDIIAAKILDKIYQETYGESVVEEFNYQYSVFNSLF